MPRILGVSGSLRRASFNTALLRAATEVVPAQTTIESASIRDIPLYDGDLEAEHGLPESVRELKERIVQADGLLIVTPEYNNSIPGVLKNTIDWLSRPAADIARVFGNRPVAIVGATPGRGGTMLSQSAWLPVLRTLGTLPWFGGRLQVSDARNVFDADGRLVDERVRSELTRFVAGFASFVANASSARNREPVAGEDGGGVTQTEIRLPRHDS
ncbi:MAG TPA: NADPH-dependent FMN reductase [Labilithrix sp.]|nr:NADPH-dependent FMN reductase [Labilithrix sp.]